MKFIKSQNIPKLLLILSLCLFTNINQVYPLSKNDQPKPVIIIDPGHGGKDNGAKSITGLNEKDFNLYLAFAIKNRLKKDFQIEFTRSSDYFMGEVPRTNFANNAKPEIFISIHAGAVFTQNISENIFIGYCSYDLNDKEQVSSIFSIHQKHRQKSLDLARSVSDSFEQSKKIVKIQGAPFVNLSSLNMPAVLIEIGNLNSPTDSVNMKKPEYIEKIANAISRGIKNHFKKKIY